MALTTAQQALLLFKKWLGLGQTTSSREFFNETAYPGRVAVYTNQIWTQADSIPNTAPVLSNGQTSGVVQYWQNAPLTAAPGTTNAFTSSLLIDAIPFNYGDGTSYNYTIRDSLGTIIPFGQGDWIVDTDAGLVTFYSTVPANMPPNISFYKYVGTKGFTSSSVSLTGSFFGTASAAISASFAVTASYVSGAASTWDTITNKPTGLVSSSVQINTGSFSGSLTGTLIGTSSWANNSISSSFATTSSAATSITFIPSTASFATSASFAPTNAGVVSSSTQVNYAQLQNIPSGIVSSSNQVTSLLPSNVVSSSVQVNYTQLQNIPSGIISSSTQVTPLLPLGTVSSSLQINTGSFSGSFTGTLLGTSSWATNAISASYTPPSFIDNLVTVGLVGSNTNFTSIKSAVDSITDASATNTYTVRVYPGVYIEDTIVLKPYIAVKGDSSISTVVSASNPSASIFIMADQTMVIDMQIQGATAPNVSAIVYSSPTTPQTNAIAYAENIRFGTNFTNAKVIGSGSSGNCILQCSNVKYGGFTQDNKSFDVGFHVTSGSSGGIGRMQLRNVTSTNGGVAGSSQDQIFALADAPGCTFIVNGCLLTRAVGSATGTAFKVYNGGQLRLTGVNFQRWTKGIWAPQTGSAPSIDAVALNFENCTTDIQIDHSGSIGKISGTDNFLKTIINTSASLYEVGQDPRRITVAKKGGDFTSISASVAYITDSTDTNRYVIEVGPGKFIESEIDLSNKPYVTIVGSDIQTTEVEASSSNHNIFKLGNTNQVSFMTVRGAGTGYAAFDASNLNGFSIIHKISIYDCDYGVKVTANASESVFYGEYVDINGVFTYGTYVSSSNGITTAADMENYYLFPAGVPAIGNFATGPSGSIALYTGIFDGDFTANSKAIQLENGATLEAAALDIQEWDYAVVVPNTTIAPEFRVVGSMIHDSVTYDFDVQKNTTRGRFQGVSDHSKINNNSPDFYWNFLDDNDGENDVTRKLSVTFADGTHTDATTLIFKGSSMGVLEGGKIVTSSGFTVTAQSGYGYLHDPIDPEVFKRFDWTNGNITLTANSTNYLFINSSGVLSAAPSTPNFAQNIILGRVVTNDTGVEFIDQSGWNAEHTANRLSKFTRQALGPVFAEGSIVTEDAIPFRLDVTAGNYYFAENNFLPAGTSSINLTQYYPSASTWARYTSSVVPNNTYASSSQLVPMSSSAYTKHTVYVVGDGIDEKYFLVINTNQYASLVQAENAALPTIPTYFDDGVVPLAAVYVQSGSANITQIQDIRPIIGFRAAGVNASSVHGNLLGLNADDHPQYLLVNGTRAMTGNLSLGGNNITNVGTLIGTSSWANNAVTASTATSAENTDTINIYSFGSDVNSYLLMSNVIATPNVAIGGDSDLRYNASTNTLTVVNISATNLTGSLFGTSSRANTASVAISASFAPTILPSGVVSSSTQIVAGLPAGTVSSSTQVNYTQLQNIPNGIISSSLQITTLLPIGTVSSSLQINTGSFSGSFTGTLLGTSSWANNSISASFTTTASFAQSASFAPTILPSGVISSSAQVVSALPIGTVSSSTQVNYTQLQNIPTGIVSSSGQVVPLLPTGTVSSSAQINTGSFSGSFTGNFIGTSSWASNVVSASFASTASYFSGSIDFVNGLIVTGSVTASVGFTGSFTGTLLGTSSWASNVISASFASTASFVNILNQNVSASGNIEAGANLRSNFSSGDEGGEINLARPQTNTSISGSVVIDVNGNRVRIFESNLPNRGGYWDITTLGTGVGTNLAGGAGTVTSVTAGDGLTGGTITGAGTITLNTASAHFVTGSIGVLNALNVVSSSTQVSYTQLQNIPAGIVSSSTQVTALLPSGVVSSSLQINTGSFSGSFTGPHTGSTFGTASNAISSSFSVTASFAPTILPTGTVSSSTQVNYTQLQNVPTGIVSSSGQVTTLLPAGTVSSSLQINTGSFSGSFTGTFTGTSSVAVSSSYVLPSGLPIGVISSSTQVISSLPAGTVSSSTQVNYTQLQNIPAGIVSSSAQVVSLLPTGTVSSSLQINTGSFSGSFTGNLIGTSSWAQSSSVSISSSFATTASYALVAQSVLGSITSASYAATASVAITSSFATSASWAPGGSASFPFTGNAVISGSLIITGSAGLSVTGSTTILGAFQATTKSFKIDHQRLAGKKLIYGVLEGPEHGVYVRGRVNGGLTGTAIIQLPSEWEWLIDENSITVQLTPIGKPFQVYVQSIEYNTVVISADAEFDCFYFIQATRKDVPTLDTVE